MWPTCIAGYIIGPTTKIFHCPNCSCLKSVKNRSRSPQTPGPVPSLPKPQKFLITISHSLAKDWWSASIYGTTSNPAYLLQCICRDSSRTLVQWKATCLVYKMYIFSHSLITSIRVIYWVNDNPRSNENNGRLVYEKKKETGHIHVFGTCKDLIELGSAA